MPVVLTSRTPLSKFLIILLWVVSVLLFHLFFASFEGSPEGRSLREVEETSLEDRIHRRAEEFFIFVGGFPRSGTTLMRTMLDAHPDIRCGQETHVIPDLLCARREWLRAPGSQLRLLKAGVLPRVLDNAVAQFMIEIIAGHGPPAKHLCNKDPYTQVETKFLHKIFPNAKFIFMIRDGRAVAHSVVSRGVPIYDWDIMNYREVLKHWNEEILVMVNQCESVGPEYCLPVYYEQLVLQPVYNTKRIFNFLGIPWDEKVLHHEEYLNGTKLSTIEFSTDQVKKPLYLDALKSWFGEIPKDVEGDMGRIAPMLSKLGYDPYDPTPSYGEPDEYVLDKMTEEERNGYLKRKRQNHNFQ